MMWQCFHCEFATDDRDAAKLHFGPNPAFRPSCRMTDEDAREEAFDYEARWRKVWVRENALHAAVKLAYELCCSAAPKQAVGEVLRNALSPAPPREAVGVGIEGASRTESGGSPPLRAAKSDSQEGH